MNEMNAFKELVKCLESCADLNANIATSDDEYARGKYMAFSFAARRLRKEIELYEKESR